MTEKDLGNGVGVSLRQTGEGNGKYDVFVKTSHREYCLLQCAGHGTRSNYSAGASLEEARELYESLNAFEDVHLIRGVNPPLFCAEISPEEIDHESLEKSFESFARRRGALREIGSRFFTGFDRA